jgi:hypothetical protein
MERWLQIDPYCWRKEADLPIGHAVAEIRKHPTLAVYSARVEVACAAPHLPAHSVKSMLGLLTQAEAEQTCNNFLAECVAAELISGPEGVSHADSWA